MLAFLAAVALAQAPQTFDPVSADVRIDGKTYSGILVDEATFAELGRLRVQAETNAAEIKSFEEWKAKEETLFTTTIGALHQEHLDGQKRLTDFYEKQLREEKTRDAFQRHAFALGLVTGFVGSSALTMVVINAYDHTLPSNLTGGAR